VSLFPFFVIDRSRLFHCFLPSGGPLYTTQSFHHDSSKLSRPSHLSYPTDRQTAMVFSSSTTTSPIHKASLVDPALHSPALLELLEIKVSRPVIGMFSPLPQYLFALTKILEYVVDCVVDTVDYAMGRPSSSRRSHKASRHSQHSKFTTFVSNVLTRAEVTLPTLLVSLVYINRAKPHLQIALEEWACERVFLGAIMVASKVHTLP